jgi:hypothetical protein
MSSSDVPVEPWSVLTYRISTLEAQQRILVAFREITMPGATALGTYVADMALVVVESATRTDQAYSKRLIHLIDPDAYCMTPAIEPESRTWSEDH